MKRNLVAFAIFGVSMVNCWASNTPAPSKIGIHLIARYTEGAKKIIAANCNIIKVIDTTPEMLAALSDFKRLHPRGVTVLRIYTPTSYKAEDDPVTSARDYWNRWLYPSLRNLTPQQKKLIDYLEGTNECDNTPCWGSVDEARWYCSFWSELAKIMAENGFKPCVGSLPVGSPPGPPSEIEAKLKAFIPALRTAKKFGGAWSYHAYTLKYTKDPEIEIWYSLRYRQFYSIFKQYAPDLLDLPIILTEGGVDNDGNHPQKPGWKRDSAEKYKDWLQWFDAEMKRDPYVLGVTLFEIGHPEHWDSFDLEPIADWLADYLGSTK